MSSIDFEEDDGFHIKSRAILGEPKTPAMITALLKTGVVKNEKQALLVLSLVIIITLTATIFIALGLGGTKKAYIEDDNGNRYQLEEYLSLKRSGLID